MKSKLYRMIPVCLFMCFANPLLGQEPTYTNNLGMVFVLIRPGSMIVGKFQPTVGKPEKNSGPGRPIPEEFYKIAAEMAKRDAMPGFTVNIRRPYYIGKFEITQEQWVKVMGHNPSVFQNDTSKDHPVENITWQD